MAIEAKNWYKETHNGQLTDELQPSLDTLSVHDALIQQKLDWGEVMNGQSLKFKQIILYYITTTNRLS